jgi:hypothetical protein
MTDQQPLLNQPAPNWSQAPAPWVQQPQPTFQQYPPAQQYPPQYAPPGQWAGYPPAAQYPPYQPPYAPRYLPPTDQRTNSVEVTFAWILTVLTVLYFLPWAIAATRGKSNSGAIAVLNFLLGWTFIGWVAALVMACSAHQRAGAVNVVVVQPGNYYR